MLTFCKPYLDEEIAAALFQMGQTKALGPDGFPAFFTKLTGNSSRKKYVMRYGLSFMEVRFNRVSMILS
jgi:hypothetical protein